MGKYPLQAPDFKRNKPFSTFYIENLKNFGSAFDRITIQIGEL